MPTPDNTRKAWGIVSRTIDPEDPNTKLAESIARSLDSAQEEGYRSAFQQMRPPERQANSSFGVFIVLGLLIGFVVIMLAVHK